MGMNRVQFQAGLSMPEFFERMEPKPSASAALEAARWPEGFGVPGLRRQRAHAVRAPWPGVLAVRWLRPSMQPDQRHGVRVQQAAAVALVPGHATADPGQEQRLGPRTQAPVGRALQDRLADEAQDHGGDARARGASRTRRARGDRRRLSGRRASAASRAGLGEQDPFVAAVQTTVQGQARCWPVCRRSVTTRSRRGSLPPARSRRRPASSPTGLCFRQVQLIGAEHQAHRYPRRQGKRGAAPVSRRVNTVMSNLKTALRGPTTRSSSPSTLIAISPSSSTDSTAAST